MKNVLNLVESEKQNLQNSSFCEWMRSVHEKEDPFSFIPSMSFFVLGFRDILNLAKRSNTNNEWDLAINHHCDEDKNHWLWFVHDLEYLGFSFETWGPRSGDILRTMWSDNNRPVRDMVYLVTHLIQKNKNPFVTLSIIESLEAAFGVFIDVLRPQVEKHQLYEKLKYFGRKHDEGEQAHALGNWVDGIHVDSKLEQVMLSNEELALSQECVKQIFNQFELVFHNWYETRGRFKRHSSIENITNSTKEVTF